MNLVVGSINYDFTIYVSEFPEAGQTVTDGELFESPGGKGLNQAIASARSGTKTTFVGSVGNDFISKLLTEVVKKEKKENKNFLPYLITSKGNSGCAFITVRKRDGENKIVVSPGANRTLSKGKVYELLKKIDFSSILLQCELEEEVIRMCIEFAKRKGKSVFLNAAPFRPWLKDIYHLVDFLIMNESEAMELAKTLGIDGNINDIAKELSRSSRNVLITLGERGVIFCGGNRCFQMDAFEVNSIDTVGAGDSFCGYFVSHVNKGKSIEEALIFASAAGALSTTKRGVFHSIPYLYQVEKFLRKAKRPAIREL